MTTALVKIEAAVAALAECTTLDVAAGIMSQAAAYEAWIRKAKLGLEAQNHAAEIKLRAERRAGELLAVLDRAERPGNGKAGPGRGKKNTSNDGQVSEYAKTLEATGTSRQDASRWQRVAEVPEQTFEQHIAETKAAGQELTSAGVQRLARGCASAQAGYDGDEWITPPEILELGRTVLGRFDTDPASSKAAQQHVKAQRYFTKEDDGLAQPWKGLIWLNPPYSSPLVDRFTARAHTEWSARNIGGAILLVNNATETAWFQALLDLYPACFPKGRIGYLYPGAEGVVKVDNNRQGQALFYLGPDAERFARVFRTIGVVVDAM